MPRPYSMQRLCVSPKLKKDLRKTLKELIEKGVGFHKVFLVAVITVKLYQF